MLKALLIDDDPVEREILKAHLKRRYGSAFELVFSTSIDDAVGQLRAGSFDIIILDNRVPPYDRYRDSVPEIQDIAGDAVVYVISASTDNPIFENAPEYGVAGVFDKFDIGQAIEGGAFDEDRRAH